MVPTTSTTLLRDLASDAQHTRWREFVARYQPMLEAYVRTRFPSLEVEDVVQETLVSLIHALPNYRYVPEEKGHFHNYLIGILRHKAIRVLNQDRRQDEIRSALTDGPGIEAPGVEGEAEWRNSLLEVALRQLLEDETIHDRTKRIFERIAIGGEDPQVVADAFLMKRHAVDQIRNRMLAKLRTIVEKLESVDGVRHDRT